MALPNVTKKDFDAACVVVLQYLYNIFQSDDVSKIDIAKAVAEAVGSEEEEKPKKGAGRPKGTRKGSQKAEKPPKSEEEEKVEQEAAAAESDDDDPSLDDLLGDDDDADEAVTFSDVVELVKSLAEDGNTGAVSKVFAKHGFKKIPDIKNDDDKIQAVYADLKVL